jgi:putative transposase
MIRFCFRKGMVLLEGQTRRQLQRQLSNNKLQFEQESGELENFDQAEVLANWSSSKWVIDMASLSFAGDVLYLATPRDLATYPEKLQEIARRRERYIRKVEPERNGYNVQRWQAAIAELAKEINDPKPPCTGTVHNWWSQYRELKTITALIPHAKRGGHRKNDPRIAVFEEAVAEVFLTSQKLPKLEVFHAVTSKMKQVNAARAPDDQIKSPGRTTVYRWLNDLRQDIVDASRLGADVARVKYRASYGGLKVDRILERIEIDHTPLDIIVVDGTTLIPLGRPWMSLALDRYSRMVMGFYLSFNAPSSHSVLQCLRRAILPKNEWLARFPDIKGEWPAYGIPELIAVDNGMDLHSVALEKTCQELGIQILFCGAKEPEHKGAVERWFRTLAEGLIHRLPGTVFSSVDERGDYPSEDLAAIDLETLTHVVTQWVVDIYNVSPHEGIGTTPLQRWKESALHCRIELPAYPGELEVITGIPAVRTLFHYGIELEGMHYNSRQLQEIRRRAGKSLKVQLKFYEDDVDFVHVFDPYAKEYLKVAAVHSAYAENLPRSVHRLIREYARRQFGEQYSATQLEEAKASIQEKIKASIDYKKMATRKSGASLLRADSESVLRGSDPLNAARKDVKSSAAEPPEVLPDGLSDEIPIFKPIQPEPGVKNQGENDDAA